MTDDPRNIPEAGPLGAPVERDAGSGESGIAAPGVSTKQVKGLVVDIDPNAPAKKRADELESAIREHAGVVVREMEAYYRDGRHPDLRPVLRAGRALLELTGKEA